MTITEMKWSATLHFFLMWSQRYDHYLNEVVCHITFLFNVQSVV